jgi:hypothetical protein
VTNKKGGLRKIARDNLRYKDSISQTSLSKKRRKTVDK